MNQPKDYPQKMHDKQDALALLVHSFKSAPLRARQSKLESTIEVSVNIASGFIVSYLVWLFIVPLFWPEHASSYSTAFGIVIIFTVFSVIRSLLWRRFFENEFHKVIHSFIKGNL